MQVAIKILERFPTSNIMSAQQFPFLVWLLIPFVCAFFCLVTINNLSYDFARPHNPQPTLSLTFTFHFTISFHVLLLDGTTFSLFHLQISLLLATHLESVYSHLLIKLLLGGDIIVHWPLFNVCSNNGGQRALAALCKQKASFAAVFLSSRRPGKIKHLYFFPYAGFCT